MKPVLTTKARGARRGECGIALFLTLLALFLFSAITVAMMFDADIETGINSNFRSSQQAFYAARAGLEEARSRLLSRSLNSSGTADNISAPSALPSTSSANVIYLLNPSNGETVNPTTADTTLSPNPYFDHELCREHFSAFTASLGSGTANISCSSVPTGTSWYTTLNSDSPGTNTSTALPYKWVRVTLKENDSQGLGTSSSVWVDSTQAGTAQVCWDGTKETTGCDPANLRTRPVFVLTSLAVTPGNGRALLQSEVAQTPPVFVNASVDSNSNVTYTGSLTISGNDSCTCTNPQSSSPGNITGKTCQQLDAVYSAGTVSTPHGSEDIYGTVAQNQTFGYNVPQLIQQFTNSPGAVVCTTSGCPTGTWGTYPTDVTNPATGTPQISIVNSDLSETSHAFAGDGVLVVNGNLTLHGGTTWYGLIVVLGTVSLSGGGSAPVNLEGAIISAGTASADSLGGSYDLQYNSCAINQNIVSLPPTVVAFRQLDYY